MRTFSDEQGLVVLIILFCMSVMVLHKSDVAETSPAVQDRRLKNYSGLPIPLHKEKAAPEQKMTGAQLLTLNQPVNINTASKEDLEAIPGIGAKTAEKIIELRNRKGSFDKPEDLMLIQGIKEKRLAKIRKYITVK